MHHHVLEIESSCQDMPEVSFPSIIGRPKTVRPGGENKIGGAREETERTGERTQREGGRERERERGQRPLHVLCSVCFVLLFCVLCLSAAV